MEADAAGAQAGDSAAAARAAEYAGIGAQPKAERSKLHARDERRRSSDAERFEPPACWGSAGPAERIRPLSVISSQVSVQERFSAGLMVVRCFLLIPHPAQQRLPHSIIRLQTGRSPPRRAPTTQNGGRHRNRCVDNGAHVTAS